MVNPRDIERVEFRNQEASAAEELACWVLIALLKAKSVSVRNCRQRERHAGGCRMTASCTAFQSPIQGREHAGTANPGIPRRLRRQEPPSERPATQTWTMFFLRRRHLLHSSRGEVRQAAKITRTAAARRSRADQRHCCLAPGVMPTTSVAHSMHFAQPHHRAAERPAVRA